MCEKAGGQIPAGTGETLFRHVNPNWLDDGQPSSQAFYPFGEKDDGCLSVDRGSLTSAAAAYVLFTDPRPGGFGLLAVGTWGLLISELAGHALTPWSDALAATADTPANPAHAVVEFSAAPRQQWKKIGRAQKNLARSRGRLHPT